MADVFCLIIRIFVVCLTSAELVVPAPRTRYHSTPRGRHRGKGPGGYERRSDTTHALDLGTSTVSVADWLTSEGSDEDVGQWTNPCGGLPSKEEEVAILVTPSDVTVDTYYRYVASSSRVASRHAAKLKLRFIRQVFRDPLFAEDMKAFTVNGVPNAHEVRTTIELALLESKPLDILSKTYKSLQVLAVYVELARQDQVLHEGPLSAQFADVLAHLYHTMCTLSTAMDHLEPSASTEKLVGGVSGRMADVIPPEVLTIEGRGNRDVRDYIILRDYVTIVEFITAFYDTLSTNT